jgi:hypothetical protein
MALAPGQTGQISNYVCQSESVWKASYNTLVNPATGIGEPENRDWERLLVEPRDCSRFGQASGRARMALAGDRQPDDCRIDRPAASG